MVDIAMRYSGASFSDIFEKNPQIYVELYLYLDGLIAENRFPLGDGVDTSSPLLIPYQGEEVAHSPQLGISGSGNLYGIQDEGDWETVSFPSNMNGCSDIEDALPRLMEQNEESNSKLGEDFFDYLVFLGEK
ncbi:hypothetical protein N7509_011497 [Penicillium cosmopolitanum]|uniref:Uncharacterized protein n=1 Tax=Penicillium cosmopolitanum TaxID=1131564 RepID=A0A9W9SGW1_9EURO|nr:uncharacterized protein N7509_011497 [Penicillium cosmopolitanum]KAJ5378378.1 hypothetical protein N7509_011497 [Penicillium cosmopolitanum]